MTYLVRLQYNFAESGLELLDGSDLGVPKDGSQPERRTWLAEIRADSEDAAYEQAVHSAYNDCPDFRLPVRAQVIDSEIELID